MTQTFKNYKAMGDYKVGEIYQAISDGKPIEDFFPIGQLCVYNGNDGLKFYTVVGYQSEYLKVNLVANPIQELSFRKAVRAEHYSALTPFSEESFVKYHADMYKNLLNISQEGLAKVKAAKPKITYKVCLNFVVPRKSPDNGIFHEIVLSVTPYTNKEGEPYSYEPIKSGSDWDTCHRSVVRGKFGLKLAPEFYFGSSANLYLAAKWAKHLLGHVPSKAETITFRDKKELEDFLKEKGIQKFKRN